MKYFMMEMGMDVSPIEWMQREKHDCGGIGLAFNGIL